jgi:serine/threonine-protein kinase
VASVPELSTRTDDPRVFARILRAALRCQTVGVMLDAPPAAQGAHLLHVLFAEKAVWVLAETAGPIQGGLWPLKLQPRSRMQAAQLYALAQIVGGGSVFPPDEAPPSVRVFSQPPPSLPSIQSSDDPSTLTLTGTIPLTQRIPQDLVDPILGRVIAGKYRIDELVGAGSVGVVYKAFHIDLERDVAVKILHEEVRSHTMAVARFKAEARGAARLDHPNIARVLDAGEEGGLSYIVMELVIGPTLETVISAHGKISTPRAIDIAFQVSGALARAHAEGIVHRDVKPENIMLTEGIDVDGAPAEIVKVCDFGVAKTLGEGAGLTVGGALVGSPAYMSPEQARGGTPEPRSDIYALGVVLYEMTTGRLPFLGEQVSDLITMHIVQRPTRPSEIEPGYHQHLEALVMQMLEKRPADRPASARWLRGAFGSLRSTVRGAPPLELP